MSRSCPVPSDPFPLVVVPSWIITGSLGGTLQASAAYPQELNIFFLQICGLRRAFLPLAFPSHTVRGDEFHALLGRSFIIIVIIIYNCIYIYIFPIGVPHVGTACPRSCRFRWSAGAGLRAAATGVDPQGAPDRGSAGELSKGAVCGCGSKLFLGHVILSQHVSTPRPTRRLAQAFHCGIPRLLFRRS